MDFFQFLNHFVALLVICNPLSALPAILRITRNQNLADKRHIGLVSASAVLIILLGTTWCGSAILTVLGIEIAAFQAAGGLIILTMAFSMLSAEESPIKQSPEEGSAKKAKEGAIIPLAIPIIAGPGAISMMIVSVSEFPGFINHLILSCSAIFVSIVMGIILFFAGSLETLLGQARIHLIARLGGLILAAIAIQTIVSGLKGLFPILN